MNSIAIIIIILSALMHSIWNVLVKKSKNKIVFIWLVLLSSLVMFFPLFFYLLLTTEISLKVLFFIELSGIFVAFHFYFLSKTYTKGDLSLGYPMMKSSSLFIFFLAIIFLNEKISTQGIIGIFAIVLGIYILNLKSLKLNSLITPFKSMFTGATLFALITALFYSFHIIIDKFAGGSLNPFMYLYLLWVSQILFMLPIIILKKNNKCIKDEWKINYKTILISGFFITFSYILVLVAFRIETASQIVSLRQLSIVFGVILGSYVLKEKHGLIRIFGALIIFIGTILVALS